EQLRQPEAVRTRCGDRVAERRAVDGIRSLRLRESLREPVRGERRRGHRVEVRPVERVQELAAELERDVPVNLDALDRAQVEPYECRGVDDEAADAAVAEARRRLDAVGPVRRREVAPR